MVTAPANFPSEYTHLSRDTLGRWVCNTLSEALMSASGKPFDVIVIGGGSFGAVFAQHLFDRDRQLGRHRILVLEAGPFDLPEHVQNIALPGLGPPAPSSIADLRAIGQDKAPRNEVWGLPWHSSTPFPGLAYSIGGRSAFFGGWSPRLLDGEMPLTPDARHPYPWPQPVVDELKQRYFDEAAAQIGTDTTNDFITGDMHDALRRQLHDGIAAGGAEQVSALGLLPVQQIQRNTATDPRGAAGAGRIDGCRRTEASDDRPELPCDEFGCRRRAG